MDKFKKIKLKHALIPVAAFALTVGTASAFSSSELVKHLSLDLSEEQLKALEEVQTIRDDSKEEVEAVLEAAGLDKEKMKQVREAVYEAKKARREAINAAVEADDFEAFLTAVEGSPVGEVVDTEEEFAKFVTAHELIKAGDREAAGEIMTELGLPKRQAKEGDHSFKRGNSSDKHEGKRGEVSIDS